MKSNQELRERLAEVSHEIWSHWMKWQFSVCESSIELASGKRIELGMKQLIPDAKVERWTRQLETPYEELTEQEKESDREQADKILAVLVDPERQARRDALGLAASKQCGGYPKLHFALDNMSVAFFKQILTSYLGAPEEEDEEDDNFTVLFAQHTLARILAWEEENEEALCTPLD